MARPQPIILEEIEDEHGHWQLLDADEVYIILYNNRPVNLRLIYTSMNSNKFKYKRMSYTEEGSARRQVNLLNKKFNTTSFTYIKQG